MSNNVVLPDSLIATPTRFDFSTLSSIQLRQDFYLNDEELELISSVCPQLIIHRTTTINHHSHPLLHHLRTFFENNAILSLRHIFKPREKFLDVGFSRRCLHKLGPHVHGVEMGNPTLAHKFKLNPKSYNKCIKESSFCFNSAQRCPHGPFCAALFIHSIYHNSPQDVADILCCTTSCTGAAVVHRFEGTEGKFMVTTTAEATWKRRSNLIEMSVRGNASPYIHPNVDWIFEQGHLPVSQGTLVWEIVLFTTDKTLYLFTFSVVQAKYQLQVPFPKDDVEIVVYDKPITWTQRLFNPPSHKELAPLPLYNKMHKAINGFQLHSGSVTEILAKINTFVDNLSSDQAYQNAITRRQLLPLAAKVIEDIKIQSQAMGQFQTPLGQFTTARYNAYLNVAVFSPKFWIAFIISGVIAVLCFTYAKVLLLPMCLLLSFDVIAFFFTGRMALIVSFLHLLPGVYSFPLVPGLELAAVSFSALLAVLFAGLLLRFLCKIVPHDFKLWSDTFSTTRQVIRAQGPCPPHIPRSWLKNPLTIQMIFLWQTMLRYNWMLLASVSQSLLQVALLFYLSSVSIIRMCSLLPHIIFLFALDAVYVPVLRMCWILHLLTACFNSPIITLFLIQSSVTCSLMIICCPFPRYYLIRCLALIGKCIFVCLIIGGILIVLSLTNVWLFIKLLKTFVVERLTTNEQEILCLQRNTRSILTILNQD